MSKKCNYCGAELSENDAFCGNCGAATEKKESVNPTPAGTQPNAEHISYSSGNYHQEQPHYYQPPVNNDANIVSIGAYIGYSLLFSIPVVGLIISIIMAVNNDNRSLKNYAIAHLIMMGVGVLLSIIFSVLMIAVGVIAATEGAFITLPLLI
ncbi:MAG: zinc-ribbon domain-containing protein [Clostridia bacterium]|nr:zinc-ribbon domain-containing protein [Clostridia bacterium]